MTQAVRSSSVQAAPSRLRRVLGFSAGILVFSLIVALPAPAGMSPEAQRTAATVALMACWWIGESIPLGVTALVPLVAFPMLGIMPSKTVAPNYTNHFVFLLLGGFFIAIAMQRWQLHRRIALWIIRLVGTSSRQLVLGFMLATAFLSMWISNSATAMMMMPIGLGLIHKAEELHGHDAPGRAARFGTCLMLGIAYAANIGGVATLVGTFPNLVFAGMLAEHYPAAPEITFVDWLEVGLPFALLFIPLMWLYLVGLAAPVKGRLVDDAEGMIREEIDKLGSMGRGEATVLAVFVGTALLWIFRSDIALGVFTIPGWSNLLGLDSYVNDATVAMAMGILCFLLPADDKGTPLLDWEHGKTAPWGILLLFGGGFAIAAGFTASGLTEWIGVQLGALQSVPIIVVMLVIALTVTFLTEMTSNTATTTMMLPILAATAHALDANPLALMLPATISASCAFMLPIGTPPNAIVFASGRVSLMQMAKAGFWLNLLGAMLIAVFLYFWLEIATGTGPLQMPGW